MGNLVHLDPRAQAWSGELANDYLPAGATDLGTSGQLSYCSQITQDALDMSDASRKVHTDESQVFGVAGAALELFGGQRLASQVIGNRVPTLNTGHTIPKWIEATPSVEGLGTIIAAAAVGQSAKAVRANTERDESGRHIGTCQSDNPQSELRFPILQRLRGNQPIQTQARLGPGLGTALMWGPEWRDGEAVPHASGPPLALRLTLASHFARRTATFASNAFMLRYPGVARHQDTGPERWPIPASAYHFQKTILLESQGDAAP